VTTLTILSLKIQSRNQLELFIVIFSPETQRKIELIGHKEAEKLK